VPDARGDAAVDASSEDAAAPESRVAVIQRRFAALEVWLRTRPGLLALWLTTAAATAVVMLLMYRGGIPGWDDAAHLYKIWLLRKGESIFWDSYWYGGGYGAITYGFVYYWLAQYIPGALFVIVSSATIPVCFYLYMRRVWRCDDVWPAWSLSLTMALYFAHGQAPFVFALALSMVALALFAGGHPLWAVLPFSISIFSNPMGIVVVFPFMLADFLARPEVRRRCLLCAVALAPAALVRLGFGRAFSEPGYYYFETAQLLVFLAFAFVGLGLAGVNTVHPRRPLVILFLTYAGLCLISFALPGSPLGSNTGRFFMVFGGALIILLRHTRLRRPWAGLEPAIIPVIVFFMLQYGTAIDHFIRTEERPQTERSFFAPALAAAQDLYEPNHRIHVVALRRYWEAFYFPEAGYPITRGWYRQADAIHNGFFYTTYQGSEYVRWLRDMGAEYIFLPLDTPLDTPLEMRSRREAQFLDGMSDFELIREIGTWRIYRLRAAEPLLVAGTERSAETEPGAITAFDHQRIDFSVTRPGSYLLKVTASPYWVLDGPGTVRTRSDHFMDLELREAGAYRLRFVITPARVLKVLAGREP